MTNRFAVGFSISVVLFLGSLLLPVPQRYLLWTVALALALVDAIHGAIALVSALLVVVVALVAVDVWMRRVRA